MSRNYFTSVAAACLLAIGVPLAATATPIISFTSPINLAVLGLANTTIVNSAVTIHGSEGVYSGGSIANNAPSTITGDVYTYSTGQFSGPGQLNGTLYAGSAIDPNFTATFTDLTTAVNNALGDATAAAGLTDSDVREHQQRHHDQRERRPECHQSQWQHH